MLTEENRCLQHTSKWLLLLSKGWVFNKKDGSYCVQTQTLSEPKKKAFYSPENVFLQPFCLQRATSPAAQEIGQLRYRLSSKPQSWLLAQILAFSFPFALWKQFCHLSARQMLCLAPKNGIWLHPSPRHLARKPAAGRLACGAPWRAAEAAEAAEAAAKLQGRRGKAAGRGCQRLDFPGFLRERFCLLSLGSHLN